MDRRTREHSELTPSQRTQRAKIAAHARWAQQDGEAGTRAARAAFLDRFTREVDPEGVLPLGERMRRAEHAKAAHFRRMALARHSKKTA